jgi:hypothetical protein
LERLCRSGNELLKPRLDRLLAGQTRADLLDRLKQAQATWSIDNDIAETVQSNLRNFEHDQPALHGMLQRIDQAAAFARPVLTVGLGVAGGFGAEHIADAVGQSLVVHVVGDLTGGVAATAAGEGAIQKGATWVTRLQMWFRQLQKEFSLRRAGRYAAFIETNALGALLTELRHSATIPQSEEYRRVQDSLDRLTVQLQQAGSGPCNIGPGH